VLLRKLLKFLHTMSAIGLAGGLASYMMVLAATPHPSTLETYASLRASLAFVADWLILPSMVIVLASGLLAMAAHYPFLNTGWVWLKAVSGILIFEATLTSVGGPAGEAAKLTSGALAGEVDAARLDRLVRDEWGAWWMLLALSTANVLVAIWRPRFRWVLRPRNVSG
jgi:hypothetical protein